MKVLLFLFLFTQNNQKANYDTINITKYIHYDTTNFRSPKYRFSVAIDKTNRATIKKIVKQYKYCYLIMDSFMTGSEMEFMYRLILTEDIKKQFKIKILKHFGPHRSKFPSRSIHVYLYLTNSKINSFNEAQIDFKFLPVDSIVK